MEQVRLAITLLIALFLITSPALALTITLNYPPNNAQTIDTTPTFNLTPIGSSSSYNCTLYIDGTSAGEATNIANNTAAEITPSSALSAGDHNWNITCEGVGTTETGTSETRVIGIGENFSRCAIFIDPGTYKLTADIVNSTTSNCLNLQANDIVLDCQGHLLDGDDAADYGIYIKRDSAQTTNITIKNCIIKDWGSANIYLYYADGNFLENISVSSSPNNGIYLDNSNSNTLANITAYANNWHGIYLFTSDSNTLSHINTTNNLGYDLLYLAWSSSSCSATFENVTGTGNKPILFYNHSVTIKDWNNNVSEIILCNADNSIIDNLTLIGNENNGLILTGGTENATIKNSYFRDLEYIFFYRANSNTLSNTLIYSNNYGIYLDDSNSNIIKNSIIYDNSGYGIYLYSAGADGPNLIYNNYLNNTNNFYFGGTIYSNQWNTTLQSGNNIIGGGFIAGNFWAKPDGTGYSQICNDTNIDGICDDPYSLETNNIDYLPLSPYYDGVPPEITFLTAGAHSPGSVTVKFEAEDNVVNCTLEIDGVSYSLYRDGNIFWTNYTLTKGVMAVATCWDSADWRINNTTVSAAYFLAGGVGGMGGGPVPVLRTHYPLSFTIATPTPATIYIYTPDGELVKKLEDVSGFSHTYLPKGDYVIKVVTEGRVRTYEITLDRPKAIAITPQTTPFLTWNVILGLLILFGLGFLIGYKEKKKR